MPGPFDDLETAPLAPQTLEVLGTVGTATLSMQLLKRGIRRHWMNGPKPLDPAHARFVGEAFTLCFLPLREDLGSPESYARPGSIREAIEAMPSGKVMVVDARGEQGAAPIGDLLLWRMQRRGAIAFVSDGAVRDVAEIRRVGIPTFCTGTAAPPSIAGLVFAGWGAPIGCGGATVLPGDIVAGDEDGVVVVPRALADEIAENAPEQERFERYVQMRVRAGDPVVGLYPPNEQTLQAYQAWLDAGEPEE